MSLSSIIICMDCYNSAIRSQPETLLGESVYNNFYLLCYSHYPKVANHFFVIRLDPYPEKYCQYEPYMQIEEKTRKPSLKDSSSRNLQIQITDLLMRNIYKNGIIDDKDAEITGLLHRLETLQKAHDSLTVQRNIHQKVKARHRHRNHDVFSSNSSVLEESTFEDAASKQKEGTLQELIKELEAEKSARNQVQEQNQRLIALMLQSRQKHQRDMEKQRREYAELMKQHEELSKNYEDLQEEYESIIAQQAEQIQNLKKKSNDI